jgi:very-short-patch-repair endonuclease
MKKLSIRKFARAQRRNMNHAEALVWSFLRQNRLHGFRFRRQFPIGPHFADFACPRLRLTVEIDGTSHWSEDAQARDATRRAFLQRAGWHEIRVSNDDVYRNLDGVLEYIGATARELEFCNKTSTQRGQGVRS